MAQWCPSCGRKQAENSEGTDCPACGTLIPGAGAQATPAVAEPEPELELELELEPSLTDIARDVFDDLPHRDHRYGRTTVIGRGAMGEIMSVRDRALDCRLAMKVIRADLAERLRGKTDPTRLRMLVRRFVNEARITAQLDHPGVVPVHDMGEREDGSLYYTMKLVHGQPLQRVFDDYREGTGEWTIVRVLGLLARVCDTIAFAHDQGVIHRDLKPANVMICEFGEVYVMDWGLARRLEEPESIDLSITNSGAFARLLADSDDEATQVGQILGSPPYMPPEQAHGALDNIGPHSDVYAVGAMIYQFATGKPPYVDATDEALQIIDRIRKGPPPPIRELNPAMPEELSAIAEKAMAHDFADRYPTAIELREDLQSFIDGRVVRAYRSGRLVRVSKWLARNRALSTAIGAVMLVALAGIVAFAVVQTQKAQDAADAAELESRLRGHEVKAKERAREARAEAEAESIRAEGLRLCAVATSLSPTDPSLALLLALEGGTRAPGREASTALYGVLARVSARAVLHGHVSYINGVAFSPDGKLVITTSGPGQAMLWDADSGALVHRLNRGDGTVTRGTFSRDGRLAATISWDEGADVWDTATGEHVAHMEPDGNGDVAVDPTGDLLVTWGGSRARIWSIDDPATPLREHEVGQEGCEGRIDLGRRRLILGLHRELRIWDLDSGEVRSITPPISAGHERFGQPALSPDGTLAIAVEHVRIEGHPGDFPSREHRLVVHDIPTGELLWEVAVTDGAALSRDGTRVVHYPTGVGAVRLADARTGQVLREVPHDPVNGFRFSPDGEVVVMWESNAFQAALWDVRTDAAPRPLRGHAYAVLNARFAPDGKRLATASKDMTARLWTVGTLVDAYPARVFPEKAIWTPDASAFLRQDGEGGPVELVDATTFTVRTTLEGAASADEARMRIDSTGTVAVGCVGGEIQSWDLQTGARLRAVSGFDGSQRVLSVSRGGRRAVVKHADGSEVCVDLTSGATLGEFPQASIGMTWVDGQLSDDGRGIAVAGSGTMEVRVYDAETGALRHRMLGHSGWVIDARFSPDGRRIASTAVDSTARVWDAESGRNIHVLRGLPMRENQVRWSPDGTWLAVASDEETHLFDAVEGVRLAVIPTIGKHAWFSPDGKSLMTREGRRLHRWPLDAVEFARANRPRDLSPGELNEYGIGTKDERFEYERRYAQEHGTSRTLISFALRLSERGEFDEALDVLDRAAPLPQQRPGQIELHRATILCKRAAADPDAETAAADLDAAIDALERAVDAGLGDWDWFARLEGLAAVHDDPRFEEHLEQR